MSWPNNLFSPSDDFLATNRYPPNSTQTNILPAPLEPNEGPYPFTFEQPYATRMSSPRIYTLFPSSSTASTTSASHLPQLPRPLPDRNFDNTLRDVQSALHNADMALRNAQAAFRHGRATRSNASNVVDLTGSDDFEEPPRTQESISIATRPQTEIRAPIMRMTARSSGGLFPSAQFRRQYDRRHRRQQGEVDVSSNSEEEDEEEEEEEEEEEDGDENDEEDNSDIQVRIPSIRQILPHQLPAGPRGSLARETVQADRSAVRRQRQARRDWERVERRNRERAQQQAQTDAQNNSQTSQVDDDEQQSQPRSGAHGHDSNDSVSQISAPSIDLTQNTSSKNPSEPVDLTGADDDKTLKNILAKEQQDAIAAQAKSPTTNNTTSSLSNYKCAICMDSPTNATTTICGHLFCHRCILDSLKWSERQRREDALGPRQINGLCPVCRKPLKNKEVSNVGRATAGGLVNLEIKKIPRKQYNDDRQREKFLAGIDPGKDKGKQRANTEDVADIETIDPRDGADSLEDLSQGQRKRRRVQS